MTKSSNERLSEFNSLAAQAYTELQRDFDNHVQMIKRMKADLEYNFKKIRYVAASWLTLTVDQSRVECMKSTLIPCNSLQKKTSK